MTQSSLFWFLSPKFPLFIEDILVLVSVLLYFFAGRKIEQTLSKQASVLALAVGSFYLRPVVETVINFSFDSSLTNTSRGDSLKGRYHKAPLRPRADSGLAVGICIFPLLFVPVNVKDSGIFSILFAVCVASGVLVLVSIAGGNYDGLDKTPQVIVLREWLLSFIISLISCLIFVSSINLTSLVLIAITNCLFPLFMRICIYCLQGSFSLAEAIIISESGVSLLVYCIWTSLPPSNDDFVFHEEVYPLHKMSCAVGMAIVLFFFGYSYLFASSGCRVGKNHCIGEQGKNSYSILNSCCFVGFILVDLVFCYLWVTCFVSNPERILFNYIVNSWSAIWLTVYWIVLLCLVLFLYPPHRLSLVPIVSRKYYHLVLFFILLPSLFVEAAFIRLCSIIALFLLITIELGRASHVYGIRWLVNDYMSALIDHRDNGTIYMTHLYLNVWNGDFGCRRYCDRLFWDIFWEKKMAWNL
ncbi:phosphatidate cytidylyltransferase family protein [Galdieria sulphuraria]|uniref:dolichol kinase n=1 Tax=Galdieria sulphuraria TaxID=130081 RepID=M2XVB5_GALSU|nr:phosphatidate cytidylyltransferase family protein [Galdieria sulphuraria]EME27603.1 phosphatidate cytidylyltransferase family protein [Galdieria sulphuraria]|eukprot:XP_005704123.1 phosphatidate cytidylyltransferase family protein [Galdieria sulphuraria]